MTLHNCNCGKGEEKRWLNYSGKRKKWQCQPGTQVSLLMGRHKMWFKGCKWNTHLKQKCCSLAPKRKHREGKSNEVWSRVDGEDWVQVRIHQTTELNQRTTQHTWHTHSQWNTTASQDTSDKVRWEHHHQNSSSATTGLQPLKTNKWVGYQQTNKWNEWFC